MTRREREAFWRQFWHRAAIVSLIAAGGGSLGAGFYLTELLADYRMAHPSGYLWR